MVNIIYKRFCMLTPIEFKLDICANINIQWLYFMVFDIELNHLHSRICNYHRVKDDVRVYGCFISFSPSIH